MLPADAEGLAVWEGSSVVARGQGSHVSDFDERTIQTLPDATLHEPSDEQSLASQNGRKKGRALIVVDMTDRWLNTTSAEHIPQGLSILPFVRGELQYFRERQRPVFFLTRHHHTAVDRVVRALTPRRRETLIARHGPCGFFQTDLDDHLQAAQVERITMVGLHSSSAVLLTAANALVRGYHVSVPQPCVADADEGDHQAALRLLQHHFRLQKAHAAAEAEAARV